MTAATPVATRPAPTATAPVTGIADPVNGRVAVGSTATGGLTAGGGGCSKLMPFTVGDGVTTSFVGVSVSVGVVVGVVVLVGVTVGVAVEVGLRLGVGLEPPPPLVVAALAADIPNPDTMGATHTRPTPAAALARNICRRLRPRSPVASTVWLSIDPPTPSAPSRIDTPWPESLTETTTSESCAEHNLNRLNGGSSLVQRRSDDSLRLFPLSSG